MKKTREVKLLNPDRIGEQHHLRPKGHKDYAWDIFDARLVPIHEIQGDKPYHFVSALNEKNAMRKVQTWRVNMPLDKMVEAHCKYRLKKIYEFIDNL